MHPGNDLGVVSKLVPSTITIIRILRHQNGHFDVPDGNRIESPSLKEEFPPVSQKDTFSSKKMSFLVDENGEPRWHVSRLYHHRQFAASKYDHNGVQR